MHRTTTLASQQKHRRSSISNLPKFPKQKMTAPPHYYARVIAMQGGGGGYIGSWLGSGGGGVP